MVDINYEAFYDGGYSSLNPNYGNFIGYRLSSEYLGFPGSSQTANQLGETINAIKQGTKAFEVTMVSPETAEQIPKQHFEEMKALMKLSGVRPSVHAPIIDPAGFGERGYQGEMAREDAEKRLLSAVEKSHELDPNGNIPVVIHSTAGIPGTEWRPGKQEPREFKLILINKETKEMVPVEEERKYYSSHPESLIEGPEGGILRKPRDDIQLLNETQWDKELTNIAFYKKESDEIFSNLANMPGVIKWAEKKIKTNKEGIELQKENPNAWNQLQKVSLFLDNTRQSFTSAFHKAFKYGTSEQKELLKKLAENWKKQDETFHAQNKNNGISPFQAQARESGIIDEKIAEIQKITGGGNAPKIFEPVQKFAEKEAAKTFGNLAFDAYIKFKDNSPIIAIENLYPGMAFSRGKELKSLIESSQKEFVKRAVEKGISESEAEKQAKKLIGATWDVGHLNMMRKSGFKEKDIIKETEAIAKLVKHVHLTDNFGFSDSHLPPGMGNVPFKKILETLEKEGVLDKARKIVEAPSFVQHFKKSPLGYTLSALGSPIYSMEMAPYWNQTMGVQGNYFSLPIAHVPEKHFSTYGTGLGTLPTELGGQIPGTQSRFSGTPNA